MFATMNNPAFPLPFQQSSPQQQQLYRFCEEITYQQLPPQQNEPWMTSIPNMPFYPSTDQFSPFTTEFYAPSNPKQQPLPMRVSGQSSGGGMQQINLSMANSLTTISPSYSPEDQTKTKTRKNGSAVKKTKRANRLREDDEVDEVSSEEVSDDDDDEAGGEGRKIRGSYRCSRCGKKKRGHICPIMDEEQQEKETMRKKIQQLEFEVARLQRELAEARAEQKSTSTTTTTSSNSTSPTNSQTSNRRRSKQQK